MSRSPLQCLSAHARSQLPRVGPRVYPYFKRIHGPELKRAHPDWTPQQLAEEIGEAWAHLRVYDHRAIDTWTVRAHAESRRSRKRAREILCQSLEDAVVGAHLPPLGPINDKKHARRHRDRCVREVVTYIRNGTHVAYPVLVLAHTFPKPNLEVLEEWSLAYLGQTLNMPRDVAELIADFAGTLKPCRRYGFG